MPRYVRAILVLLLPVLLGGCRMVPMVQVEDRRLPPAALSEREVQIKRAARLQGWEVEVLRPGELIVTKRRGRHMAASTVSFTQKRYSITYRNSIDLKRRDDLIHRAYNDWVVALRRSIDNEARAAWEASKNVANGPPLVVETPPVRDAVPQ